MEAGGNFIDTANKSHEGQSEELVGETVASSRDRWVLATKYAMSMAQGDPNAAGNSRKNMARSVHQSLRRLGTDYIDLLWVREQGPNMVPIVGARRRDQLVELIGAADFRLGDGHLARLDEASRIDLGFPHTFVSQPHIRSIVYGDAEPRIDLPAAAKPRNRA